MSESRMSPAYEEGAEEFLQFASERSRPDEDVKFFCPCINFEWETANIRQHTEASLV